MPTHNNDEAGIIVLSHGSRLEGANALLDEIVRTVRRKTALAAIVPAYFQFCRPGLDESVQGLIAKGHRTIIIVPFFLFNGNHVTRDIPAMIEEEKVKYPGVDFIYTKNLGDDARLSDIVADMIKLAAQNVTAY